MTNYKEILRLHSLGINNTRIADAKIGIPAPSACSLGTTLPEFQPHFHALKPQCLIIGLAQPYCD